MSIIGNGNDALTPSPEFLALMAGTRGGKVRPGRDIAKTVARRATDEERWRYGVELRITGSRWRQQKPAPHYPAVEPYVYRKAVHSLAWSPYRVHGGSLEEEYKAWLKERDAVALRAVEVECPASVAAAEVVARAPVEEEVPGSNVVPFVREPAREAPAAASLLDRKAAAAELLREIAAGYGPRRAHKLRAMADWLMGVPSERRESAS